MDKEAERSRELVAPLIAKLDKLAPELEEEIVGNEEEGRLSGRTMDLLREARIPSLLISESLGGLGMFPRDALEVLERIGRIDGSISWIGGIWGGTGLLLPYYEADVARQLLGGGDPLFGASGAPSGRAVPVEGGFRLSGAWSYGSGDLHADYVICTAVQLDSDGRPAKDPLGNPLLRLCTVRGSDIKPRGNWDTIGLRATGSIDFAVEDVFVPHNLTFDLARGPVSPDRQQSGGFVLSLYLLHTPFALGASRRLLDELTTFANQPNSRGVQLADNVVFRAEMARQEVAVRSARAYVYQVWDETDALLKAGRPLTRRNQTELRAAMVHIHEVARDVAQFVFTKAGGTTLRAGGLQRWVRDTLSGCQHFIVQDSVYPDVAWELMGAPENVVWGPNGLVTIG
ncbi:acyl-CoA dehydrogenase family protein [Streptomyces sp. NPDC013157]|uniref:acyl-CoA dehydrogenase family protein n=1 Tax=Streptomyces sp. NPDC013157 TaxID=3364861 RepID=UPI003688AF64